MLQIADIYALAGNWGNAILQYYEYLYRFPEDSIIPVVYCKIAAVYEKSNKLDFAQSYLQKVVDRYSDTKYDLESRMRLSVFLFEKGDYDSSLYYALLRQEFPLKTVSDYNFIALNEISLVDSILTLLRHLEVFYITYCMVLLISIQHIGLNYASYVIELNVILSGSNSYNLAIEELIKDLEVLPSMNWIRKWGEISLSGIIPGLGRIVLGEYWDRTLTMLSFYGLCGIALITERYYPQLYYYVGTGIFLYYSGNIYSTFIEKKRYEFRLKKDYLEKLTKNHSLQKVLCLEDPIKC